ncbi:MAG TPA: hypothetical protein VLI39_02605 [Sedimentisphaerales bacterium]|nr:hypothetical protein [Sedimentisphaerales bacterium]
MKVKHAQIPVICCPGPLGGERFDGGGNLRQLITRWRGLCIIRLVGLLAFAGTANLCVVAETRAADSSSGAVAGPIRDPMNPHAYMSQLASKLNTSDSKGLLMKGMTAPPAKPVQPSQAKTPPAQSAPQVPATTSIPAPAPSSVPPAQPMIGRASVSTPMPAVTPAPVVKALPSPAPKAVPIVGGAAMSAAPKEPVQAVATPVWNGLSSDNQAAMRAMEQIEALRVKKAAASAAAQNPQPTATSVASGASAMPAAQPMRSLNQALLSAKPGLTLWDKPAASNLADKVVLGGIAAGDPNATISALAAASEEKKPWSLGSDLDKYRAHAVKEGSRNSGESLKKALERAGMTIGDGVNVFILGYGSEKAKSLRANDGKGLLDEPGRVPRRAGQTIASFTDGVYSLADLITLDALPDPIKDVYKDNNPLVRPLIFTGRTIGGVWKTTEEIGNAVTWGYFDNVTGCVGIVVEDILELFKHMGQAATNLARVPVHLLAGGKKEGAERAMDWVLLVPLEFVSNSVEMKGIANMEEYKKAFEDKGVIGSVLEFGGSTFLAYRAVDKLIDELKDKNRRKRTTSSSETPVDNPTQPPVTPTNPVGSELLFVVEGEWPTATTGAGVVIFDGQFPTITVLIE